MLMINLLSYDIRWQLEMDSSSACKTFHLVSRARTLEDEHLFCYSTDSWWFASLHLFRNHLLYTRGNILWFWRLNVLWQDAVTWLLNPPDQSLAFLLADNGFDVWLVSVRGTKYSLGHRSLSPDDAVSNIFMICSPVRPFLWNLNKHLR